MIHIQPTPAVRQPVALKFSGEINYSEGSTRLREIAGTLEELVEPYPIRINLTDYMDDSNNTFYKALISSPISDTVADSRSNNNNKGNFGFITNLSSIVRSLINQFPETKEENARLAKREQALSRIASYIDQLTRNGAITPEEDIRDCGMLSDLELEQHHRQLESKWAEKQRAMEMEKTRKEQIQKISAYQSFLVTKGLLAKDEVVELDHKTDNERLQQLCIDLHAKAVQACPRSFFRKRVKTNQFKATYGFEL